LLVSSETETEDRTGLFLLFDTGDLECDRPRETSALEESECDSFSDTTSLGCFTSGFFIDIAFEPVSLGFGITLMLETVSLFLSFDFEGGTAEFDVEVTDNEDDFTGGSLLGDL